MMDDERWLPIPGERGYEVSSHGRIRTWRNKHGGLRSAPLVMRHYVEKSGYARISLADGRRHAVHALVLTTFVGPRPPGLQCRHFPDRDPLNNRIENLSWGTCVENQADKAVHGTMARGARNGNRTHPEMIRRGERSPHAKLKDSDIPRIRAALKQGVMQKTLAARFGVTDTTIRNVTRGRTFAHIRST